MKRSKRLKIYKRDGYKCLICGSSKHLTIDHILPRCKGGRDQTDNLQTLCEQCNLNKDYQAIDYRNLCNEKYTQDQR